MLDKIGVKPIPIKKTPFKEMRCISTYVKPSTHSFVVEEAEARNMTVGAFVREMFERLESGEF